MNVNTPSKAYSAPKVTVIGSLTELTKGNTMVRYSVDYSDKA